ncbi:hypothetical protein LJR219_002380 [Phenylobacterium sp. LjRoot219]|uniref:hypothetical protein n=1 Tax=Phenylobacterium sp. LjRoot219 TaxID=3342283 RepID=UPI003ECC6524
MATDSLREHLEWHLRRLKGARAAAAELSLRPETDGLQWLSLTHFAVLALEATLADDLAPDHSALAEVIADLTPTQPVAETAAAVVPPRDPVLADSWTAALTNLSALAFPWRPPAGSAGRKPPAS